MASGTIPKLKIYFLISKLIALFLKKKAEIKDSKKSKSQLITVTTKREF